MTLDGFYSHFMDDIDQKGFEMPFKFSPFNTSCTNITANNGIVTAATITGLPLIENYSNDKKADQYSLGWNTLWDGHNGWKAMADLSWSRTDRTEHRIETTAGRHVREQPAAPTVPPRQRLRHGFIHAIPITAPNMSATTTARTRRWC